MAHRLLWDPLWPQFTALLHEIKTDPRKACGPK